MGDPRTIVQGFEDWRGLDLRRSELNRPGNTAKSLNNLEILENFSLRGRRGFKLCAPRMNVGHGLANYEYIIPETLGDSDTSSARDGSSATELIYIGQAGDDAQDGAWKLVQGKFDITYSGAASTWGFSILPRSDQTGIDFILTADSSTLLTVSLGTGYEETPTTLYSLFTQIDAVASFAVAANTNFNYAVVDGNQDIPTAGTITVDAGHTFSVGEWVYFNTAIDAIQANSYEVVATSATTLTVPMSAVSIAHGRLVDNQIIGSAIFPAALADWCPAFEDSGATKYITFNYWEKIPSPWRHPSNLSGTGMFYRQGSDRTIIDQCSTIDARNASTTQKRECLYVTSVAVNDVNIYYPPADTSGFQSYDDDPADGYTRDNFGVYKYDGKDFYMSGLPRPLISGSSFSAGSNLLASSTYRWKASLFFKDYRGNEIEHFNQIPYEYTIGASAQTVTLTVTATISSQRFNILNAYVNGGQAGVTTITVDGNAANKKQMLRTGHNIYFTDSSGVLHKRQVTAWTDTTITISGAAVTVSDNAVISTMLIRLWRTTTNGTAYYLCKEKEVDLADQTVDIADAVTDATLGLSPELLEPERIQYGLPKGRALTTHQGVIVSAGGFVIPRELHWEDPETPEFSPRASHNEVLPFSTGGDIEEIESNNDVLTVFTPSAMLQIGGSLPFAQVEIGKASEGGGGCASPTAGVPAEERVYAAAPTGPVQITNGQYDRDFPEQVAPLFINPNAAITSNNRNNLAVSLYEPKKHRIHFCIPNATLTRAVGFDFPSNQVGSPSTPFPTTSSLWVIYDWLNKTWYQWSVPTRIFPSAGMTIFNDKIHTLCNARGTGTGMAYDACWLHRQCVNEAKYDTTVSVNKAYDFYDNHEDYDWEIKPQWDTGQNPSINKTWLDYKLYSMQPNYFIASNTITLTTYRNFDDTTPSTTRTLTFSASTTREAQCKIDSGKARTMMFKLSGTVLGNPPIITGYEYVVLDETYRKEALKSV